MQYLLLIYQKENEWESLTDDQRQNVYRDYRSLREDLVKKGNWIGGNQLQPVSTASTVRVSDNKPLITDGPFAETKEQLAGYFLIEDRKSTRLNSSHPSISYAVFCLKKKS